MSRRAGPAALLALALAACGAVRQAADPASDAPESRRAVTSFKSAPTYAQALKAWRTPEDVNDWIGANFEYDMARAMRLSESQRGRSGRVAIPAPQDFFLAPRGICVDLARFGVETLRAIDPAASPTYLMIEFAPVAIAGNTLRLHWVTLYRQAGSYYVFADSKRPGHRAGPYASVAHYIEEYARYRGREIVAWRERETYERQVRTRATRQERADRP